VSDKHAQMREMARDLIRDSAIEDAIAQKIAQIIEFIHEDRIKPLEAKLAKAVEALRHAKLNMPHPDQMIDDTLAELEGGKP
jgi:hypothetical protein